MNPLQQAIGEIVRDVAFGLQEMMAEKTPIDTGRATSSWNIAENNADETVTPALQTNRKEFAAHGAEKITKEQAMAVMRGRRQNIGVDASVIVISNALPYIEDLENGSSRQAPAGMARSTCTTDEINLLISESIAMRTTR